MLDRICSDGKQEGTRNRPIRVLIAKPGLDGHDRGAKVVSKALKDAGMEVIYLGLRQSADSILRAAEEECVDIIGLSILSGSHVPICQEIIEKMTEREMEVTPVVVGGFIPKSDVQVLEGLGVSAVFRCGSRFDEIIENVFGLGGAGPMERGAPGK